LPQPENGLFEEVSNNAWTEQSNDKDTKIIYRNGEKITLLLPPFQGQPNQYFAWMGGEFSARNVLQQNILLPAKLSSLSLTFDAWTESADDCGNDTAKVYVGNQEIGAYDLCKANNSPVNPNTGGWTRKTLPITNYAALAGQDTTIKFQVNTNATKNSNWYLDNVRLCSSDTRVAVQDRCQ
jgi:hypothetical protein